MFTKRLSAYLITVVILLTSVNRASAKSVYAIIDQGYPARPAKISVYGIDGNQIDLQVMRQYDDVNYPTGSAVGPVGVAIDSDSGYMFVTHESLFPYGIIKGIQIIQAKSMTDFGWIEAPEASNLAGIVYDHEKQKVYTVDRNSDDLFVYNWNPQNKTLTLEGGQPKTLVQIGNYAAGLALDEVDDILYVTSIGGHSDVNNVVHYYDTNDWAHQGSIEIMVSGNARNAVGVAVYNGLDGQGTKYLYTGAYSGHSYLVRTDLSLYLADPNDPNAFVEKNIGAGATGISVDQDTGLVYITASDNEIKVFDGLNFPSDPCDTNSDPNINGPAGICVPTGDVSYKPPLLTLEKVDVNEPNSVIPGDYITYTITYGPNGVDHNNVVITDYLSYKVDFEDFDLNYDSETHTYTWQIGSLDANEPNASVTLTVRVNEGAEPNGTITNFCEIESDLYYTTATVDTNVGFWQPDSDIIYVDRTANAPGTGMSWRSAYVDLQDALERAHQGYGNEIWVAAGTYKPTETEGNYDAAFDLPNGAALYGGFAGTETARNQRNWITNETILDGDLQQYSTRYVVTANDVNQTAVIDGFTIKNGWKAGIYSDNSSLTIEHNKITDNGFGIYCTNSSQVTIENCEITENVGRSNYDGSGIYADDSTNLNVANCIISKNASSNNGGGIYCKDSNSLTVTNCIISDNEARNYGGGIYNSNSLSSAITDCTFSGNSAKQGGGLLNSYSSPNITNCIFTGNTAVSYGGGMYGSYSSPTVANCIFSGNKADYGGGMGNAYQSSPIITNCTFSGNSAGTYGGGMYNYHALLEPNVTNCIFWDNNAVTDGNEIHNEQRWGAPSNPTFSYCDIQDSNGSGGNWAINLGTDGGGNIDNDPCFIEPSTAAGSWTAQPSYDSSAFQTTLTDAGASWSVNEFAGKFINPDTGQSLQFLIVSNDSNTIKVLADVNSIAGVNDTYEIFDYHISSISPCVDTGDPAGDYAGQTDIDGEARLIDGDANGTIIVDMGADEYYWSLADFNRDETVNFLDYALFAEHWRQTDDVNDYNDIYDLADNNSIGYDDLARFTDDWLWRAGWSQMYQMMMGSRGSGEKTELYSIEASTLSAEQQPVEIEPLDIEEVLKWLDEIWLAGDLKETMTEEEYLEFRKAIEDLL